MRTADSFFFCLTRAARIQTRLCSADISCTSVFLRNLSLSPYRLRTASFSEIMSFEYPNVRRDETHIEDLHGHQVADPYRWLEDPSSEETRKYIEDQNKVSHRYIDSYPHKSNLLASVRRLVVYDKWHTPSVYGGSYYYFHNDQKPQPVLYRLDSLDSEPKVILDVNEIARQEGGAEGSVSVNTMGFSKEGKYIAYGLSRNGSDWVEVSVKDVESGDILKDKLEWIKFSGLSWTHDQKGFFYNRYPKPNTIDHSDSKGTETDSNTHSKLYYHRIGTPQDEDRVIYANDEHPENMCFITVSTSGQHAMIFVGKPKEPGQLVKVAKLNDNLGLPDTELEFKEITSDFKTDIEFITSDGKLFYFRVMHEKDSPRGKIVSWDLNNPQAGLKDIIAEHPSDVLEGAICVDENKLVVTYLHDVSHAMYIMDLATGAEIEKVQLPVGTINMLSGKKSISEFFFKTVSFLSPGTIYHYNFKAESKSKFSVFRQSFPPEDFNPNDFITTQKWYTSKDGTKVPMFITHSKNIELNGENPTILYGYGGFQIPLLPSYGDRWVSWLARYKNAVVVVANLRGGSEFGEDWHLAGMRHLKQNVFDDFIYAARWLIENKYTSARKLGIYGRSNGGLLVGAVLNQAPEIFGAAIPSVGVMDMLRFHKFTIGSQWKTDYGDPDNKEEFEYIYKYSPYHNIRKDLPYPSVLVTTSDHDDRVVPLHSLKYAAQLQHAVQQTKGHTNPALIYIATGSGHGGGGTKALNKVVEEIVIEQSFYAMALNAEYQE